MVQRKKGDNLYYKETGDKMRSDFFAGHKARETYEGISAQGGTGAVSVVPTPDQSHPEDGGPSDVTGLGVVGLNLIHPVL